MPHVCKCTRKPGGKRSRLTCGRFASKSQPKQPSLLAPALPSSNGHLAWEFSSLWNQSLVVRQERAYEPRQHVWASEIGGAMVDRFLRMSGVKPTNPPNARSLRKFQAADIFEWVVNFVLKRAGVLIASQEHVSFQYPGLLEVTGKLDHLAGGQPDWDKARAEMLGIGFPPIIENASLAIVEQLSKKFGAEPLETIILETKSLGTSIFDRYETLKKAAPHHRGQLFHYLKAKNMREGHVVYVCRDDCRLVEIGVFNPSDAEDDYRRDIEKITGYITAKERPPKAPEILFDDLTFRFRSNWQVEYSQYLTLLYGYDEPIAFRDKWKSSVASWNRVFKRCVTGANMTTKNELAITAAKMHFANWDDHIDRAKEAAKKNPELIETEDTEEA